MNCIIHSVISSTLNGARNAPSRTCAPLQQAIPVTCRGPGPARGRLQIPFYSQSTPAATHSPPPKPSCRARPLRDGHHTQNVRAASDNRAMRGMDPARYGPCFFNAGSSVHRFAKGGCIRCLATLGALRVEARGPWRELQHVVLVLLCYLPAESQSKARQSAERCGPFVCPSAVPRPATRSVPCSLPGPSRNSDRFPNAAGRPPRSVGVRTSCIPASPATASCGDTGSPSYGRRAHTAPWNQHLRLAYLAIVRPWARLVRACLYNSFAAL